MSKNLRKFKMDSIRELTTSDIYNAKKRFAHHGFTLTWVWQKDGDVTCTGYGEIPENSHTLLFGGGK